MSQQWMGELEAFPLSIVICAPVYYTVRGDENNGEGNLGRYLLYRSNDRQELDWHKSVTITHGNTPSDARLAPQSMQQ